MRGMSGTLVGASGEIAFAIQVILLFEKAAASKRMKGTNRKSQDRTGME
jgi:hypothetical protein